MESFSIDSKNWLMHYPTLRRVNHCRRLIQAEFGVRLHLSDPRLRDTLAHYAGNSRSRRLQEVYAELRMALIELEGPDEPSAETEPEDHRRARRMYRGQPLPEPEPDPGAQTGPGHTQRADVDGHKGRTLVYRGQTVKRG